MAEKMTRTLDQRPSPGSIIKPGELIDVLDMTLTLTDRRIYNVLVANAWDRIADAERVHQIQKAELRGTHNSGERITDSIDRLMKTIVRLRVEVDGKPAVRKVQLLAPTTEQDDRDGILYYRFHAELIDILRDSRIFGRLQREVMFAFTSKYALALYEMGEKRRNHQWKWSETFELGELRELLGVKRGELQRFANLNAWCLKPAVAEVNGLADFGVKLVPIKLGRKVTHIEMSWWKKSLEEQKAAFAEVRRHKAGRRARLAGKADVIELIPPTRALR